MCTLYTIERGDWVKSQLISAAAKVAIWLDYTRSECECECSDLYFMKIKIGTELTISPRVKHRKDRNRIPRWVIGPRPSCCNAHPHRHLPLFPQYGAPGWAAVLWLSCLPGSERRPPTPRAGETMCCHAWDELRGVPQSTLESPAFSSAFPSSPDFPLPLRAESIPSRSEYPWRQIPQHFACVCALESWMRYSKTIYRGGRNSRTTVTP